MEKKNDVVDMKEKRNVLMMTKSGIILLRERVGTHS